MIDAKRGATPRPPPSMRHGTLGQAPGQAIPCAPQTQVPIVDSRDGWGRNPNAPVAFSSGLGEPRGCHEST
eukprot:8915283-Pyramimonas_sp.AAC.1